MECKSVCGYLWHHKETGINRNIVECKSGFRCCFICSIAELIETLWNVNAKLIAIEGKSHRRINRNIVECKSLLHRYQMIQKRELIETLWNVNFASGFSRSVATSELIETLWNVNIWKPVCWFAWGFRINRNIVECK